MTQMAGPPEATALEKQFTTILETAIMAQWDVDDNLVVTAPGQPDLTFKRVE